MSKTYIVHAGDGKTSPGSASEYIEAAALASLYGLDSGDYEVGDPMDDGATFGHEHIHLIPRVDGLYRNIKNELGDNGTDTHYREMVNPEKWKRENNDINGYYPRR